MFPVSAAPWVCVRLLRSCSLTVTPRTITSPRLLSLSAPRRSPDGGAARAPLRRLTLPVGAFSTVRARLGASSISISPLDPHSYPEADRAFITVHGTGPEQEPACLDRLEVRYDAQEQELQICAEKLERRVTIDVCAPIKSNVVVAAGGAGSVQVSRMECDTCRVQTERGDCVLHSLRTHHVQVSTQGGQVRAAGTIHGNVDIRARGDGAVEVKKLQGTTMNVSTERGPLKVKAIYAESSRVSSCSGAVQLGHVHGEATVENVSGETVIDGSSGALKVSSRRGGMDVYVGEGGSAELHSLEGSVQVRVPPSLKAGLELRGTSVSIGPEIVLHGAERTRGAGETAVTGFMNADSPVEQWVRARADRGLVTLKTQSWFESLKLKS